MYTFPINSNLNFNCQFDKFLPIDYRFEWKMSHLLTFKIIARIIIHELYV